MSSTNRNMIGKCIHANVNRGPEYNLYYKVTGIHSDVIYACQAYDKTTNQPVNSDIRIFHVDSIMGKTYPLYNPIVLKKVFRG